MFMEPSKYYCRKKPSDFWKEILCFLSIEEMARARAVQDQFCNAVEGTINWSKNKLVTQAKITANTIIDPYIKTLTLRDIAVKQASFDMEGAKKTFQEAIVKANRLLSTRGIYFTKRLVGRALGKIAIAQAPFDMEGAKKTFMQARAQFKSISNDYYRGEALICIVVAQAEAGYIEEAKITVKMIINPDSTIVALSAIAVAQVEAGNIKEAKKTFNNAIVNAQNITHIYHKEEALKAIVIAQAKVGYIAEAKIIVKQIHDPDRSSNAVSAIAMAFLNK